MSCSPATPVEVTALNSPCIGVNPRRKMARHFPNPHSLTMELLLLSIPFLLPNLMEPEAGSITEETAYLPLDPVVRSPTFLPLARPAWIYSGFTSFDPICRFFHLAGDLVGVPALS